MTDGHGRTVDFKNSLIIMTSNVGSQLAQELGQQNRDEMVSGIMAALRANFKPEFLNRIDETIIFHNLTPEQLSEIVLIQIKQLAVRLAEQNIDLVLTDQAVAFLAEKGYDTAYGARPLKRVIQRHIENPLSMQILQGDVLSGSRIRIDVQGENLVIEPSA